MQWVQTPSWALRLRAKSCHQGKGQVEALTQLPLAKTIGKNYTTPGGVQGGKDCHQPQGSGDTGAEISTLPPRVRQYGSCRIWMVLGGNCFYYQCYGLALIPPKDMLKSLPPIPWNMYLIWK